MKKKLLISFVTSIVVVISLFGVVYSRGKDVVETPVVAWVSHTEYWSGDDASTIVRLADYRGNPFDVDSCTVTVLFPDKSIFVDSGTMTRSVAIPGNWYRTDEIPDGMVGTYEQEVTCVYGGGEIKTSQSFHVNPALEQIKAVDANTLALQTSLVDVNLSVHGVVGGARADILTSISESNTSLTDLMNSIRSDLEEDITLARGNLSGELSNVEATVQASIENTNETIVARIDLSETNLQNLINQVEADLQAKLDEVNVSTDAKLVSVQTELSASITTAKEEIITNVMAANTSLSNLVNDVNSGIQTQLSSVNADLNTNINGMSASLTALVGDTGEEISTELSDVNASLNQLVSTLVTDVKSYLEAYLPQLTTATTNIYTDTQWLVSNAMNQDDKDAIDVRFSSVDSNLELLKSFCTNVQTNSSALCQEIYRIDGLINTAREEQESYYTSLSELTTSRFDLLSGDLASGVTSILSELGVIKEHTTEINSTVQAIRDDQLSQIRIQVIS